MLFVAENLDQAFPEVWFFEVGVIFVDFWFPDKDEDQQHANQDQHRRQPERILGLYGVELAADQEGDDGANPAHEVDYAVCLRAIL